MSRRTLAGILAVPLLIALWVTALVVPLPYVTYAPGLTVDVLGETSDGEIIQVSGHESHHDGGELRMTTVYVTQPDGTINLFEAMSAWFDSDRALYPREAVYGPDVTREENELRSAVQMVSSQDVAVAVAMQELGYDVEEAVEVLNVSDEMPADGKIEVGDQLLRIDGTGVEDTDDVIDLVGQAPAGEPLEFVVRRGDEQRTVEVAPKDVGEETPKIGVVPGVGYTFPFEVEVNIDDNIGGPSAGLMFSLAVYDTLTEGSLTGDGTVAGTGTLGPEGRVGPIGGIQQKVIAAEDDGAELFLVPADNCAEAVGAPTDDIRLARVETMPRALESVQAWAEDPDADLPECEEEDG